MTVAITGASGHVGANLTRALLDQKRTCRVLVHKDTQALEGLDVEQVEGSVLDPDSLIQAFSGAETVFHCAARISIVGDPDGMVRKINVEGPRNVVKACLEAKVKRLIHFSSIHAYCQTPLDQPLDETRPHVGSNAPAYDRSKAAGEGQILAGVKEGLDAVIVNPTAVLGPFDFKPSRMGQVLLDLYNRSLIALIAGGFNWVDVRDVIAGALAAEQKGRTGEKYLLGGHYLSVGDLAQVVQKVSGVKPPAMTTPMWLAKATAPFAEMYAKVMNTEPLFTSEALMALDANQNIRHDKAEKELGYAPRPIEETVGDCFDWFKEAGTI